MPALIPSDHDDELCGNMNLGNNKNDGGGSTCGVQTGGARTLLQRQHSLEQKVSTSSWMTIRQQREQEGRCGECGMQTHEFKQLHANAEPTKTPLTIEHEVHRGRCLLCYPIATENAAPHNEAVSANSPVSKVRNAPSSPVRQRPAAKRRRISPASSASTDQNSGPFMRALSAVEGSCFDIVDILSAMRQFPTHRRIQELGCERLWILSWEDDNAMAIGHVGGVSTLTVAMRAFPESANLQQCACECLQNLALQEANCREICEFSDAVLLIVEAMLQHPKVASLQHCGANALCSLAHVFDGAYRTVLEESGAVHALLMATQNIHDPNLVHAVTDSLQALGYDETGRVTPSNEETSNHVASEEPQDEKPNIVDSSTTGSA